MEQPSKEGVVQAPLSNQRWLTVEQLVPGMVLARPVVVAARGVLAMKLGEGCELTASLISQMYARGIDVADVTPDMVDRFEFEIDTTRPREAWSKEVEDNIARGVTPAVARPSTS